jgi:hypothetical protein
MIFSTKVMPMKYEAMLFLKSNTNKEFNAGGKL